MNTTFKEEERVFMRLKSRITPGAQVEFEKAMHLLVDRYDTAISENRFVVGGVIKILILALLRSVSIGCELFEDNTRHGSIRLSDSGLMLSVKSNLTGMGSIRLINKLGKGERKWATATLFVIAEVGIIFGAPDMVKEDHVTGGEGDATLLTSDGLELLASSETRVIPMKIPRKPRKRKAEDSLIASQSVTRKVLTVTQSKELIGLVSHEVQE